MATLSSISKRKCSLFGDFDELNLEREVFAGELVVHIEHALLAVDRNDLRWEGSHGALEVHRLANGQLIGVGDLRNRNFLNGLRVIFAIGIDGGDFTVFFSPTAISFTAASKPGII